MATRASSKSQAAPALCCVSVGCERLLLPADAGIKLIQLLRGARDCKQRYGDGGYFYELGDELDVEYSAVKAGQVRSPKPDIPPAPLAIGHEPLKLTHR